MAWRAGARLFSRARQGLPLAAACGCALQAPADCWSFGGGGESKREQELRTCLKQANLTAGQELGAGAFATVRQVYRNASGEHFALKLIDKANTPPEVMARELEMLRTIGRHRHVVSMIDTLETSDVWGVLLDLVTGGEVFDRICEEGAFSESDAAHLVRQVALALKHVHGRGVCHRDLKPENLLLTSRAHDADVKLCDFGLASHYGEGQPPLRGMSGTIGYMAPEQLGEGVYGPEVDCWALGVVLFILLSGYHPFDPMGTADDERMKRAIVRAKYDFDDPCWKHVSPEARLVISGLLQPKPHARTTIDTLLSTPWVVGSAAETPLPDSHVNLRAFNECRKTWRAAIRAAALVSRSPNAASSHMTTKGSSGAQLSTDAKEELRAAFDAYDTDGNGTIDIGEMRHMMRALGADLKMADAAFAQADLAGNQVISFDEFCAAVGPLYSSSEQALRNAFRLFDTDGSGSIDRTELKAMLCKLGLVSETADSSIVDRMLSAADTNKDGLIDFDEFVGLFAAPPPRAT